MLPFIILFECKVIGLPVYEDLKRRLVSKNYVVSNFGSDCFAILKQKEKKPKEEKIRTKPQGLLG
jgi:hypothetical protein